MIGDSEIVGIPESSFLAVVAAGLLRLVATQRYPYPPEAPVDLELSSPFTPFALLVPERFLMDKQ